jgi:hypothetical protein
MITVVWWWFRHGPVDDAWYEEGIAMLKEFMQRRYMDAESAF